MLSVTASAQAAISAAGGSTDEPILLPASYDIIWGAVSFAIVFVLFWKFVMPRMREVLAERTEKIEGGIAKAEQMQAEAQESLQQYQQQLATARDEAAAIREKAQAEKAQIIEEARREATEAAASISANATAQIEAEKAKAIAELRKESGTVAADLAERIIGESLDEQKSRDIVDRFIAELEATSETSGN